MAAGETGRSFCGGRQSSVSRDASATQVRPPLIGRLPVASPYCFFFSAPKRIHSEMSTPREQFHNTLLGNFSWCLSILCLGLMNVK